MAIAIDMGISSYIVMFIAGYLLSTFVTETASPWKKKRWHQPGSQRMFGLSLWFAIATIPVFLDILGVQRFEYQLILGLFYMSCVMLIPLFVHWVGTFHGGMSGEFKQRIIEKLPSRKRKSVGVARPAVEQNRLLTSPDKSCQAIYIDADAVDFDSKTDRRIKRKTVTGSAPSMTLDDICTT